MTEVSELQQLRNALLSAGANAEYENRLRRRAIDELRETDKRVADLREQLERERLLRTGAEEQASRAISRLANVVETVRARADHYKKLAAWDRVAALRSMAIELQEMELP